MRRLLLWLAGPPTDYGPILAKLVRELNSTDFSKHKNIQGFIWPE